MLPLVEVVIHVMPISELVGKTEAAAFVLASSRSEFFIGGQGGGPEVLPPRTCSNVWRFRGGGSGPFTADCTLRISPGFPRPSQWRVAFFADCMASGTW